MCAEGIVIAGQESSATTATGGHTTDTSGLARWSADGNAAVGCARESAETGCARGAERYDDGNTHLDTCGGELECGGPVDSCEGGCGLGQRTTCSSNECDNGYLVAGGRMQRIMPDQVRLGRCRGESRQLTCAFQQGAGTRCLEGRRSAGRRQCGAVVHGFRGFLV